METNPIFDQLQNIALWGPTGSGKDWLIRAFAKEIEKCNRVQKPIFEYRLSEVFSDNDTRLVSANPPDNIGPTPSVNDFHYQFVRNAFYQEYRRFEYTHNIVLHNDSGSNLVSSVIDPLQFGVTYQTVINARNLIILVTPPADSLSKRVEESDVNRINEQKTRSALDAVFEADQDRNPPYQEAFPVAARKDWKASDYERYIILLLEELRKNPTPFRRNVAVCMTKSDQMGALKRRPEELFFNIFGKLRNPFTAFSKEHNIKIFKTSSAGYFRRLNEYGLPIEVPNIDNNGTLLNRELWSPSGVAAPFFWIFQTIEREHFQENRNRGLRDFFVSSPDYPPYPYVYEA